MLSRQTLSLYRDILKVIRQVPNSDHRNQLKEWARQDFKKNKYEKEEVLHVLLLFVMKGSLLCYSGGDQDVTYERKTDTEGTQECFETCSVN
ncbi:uncharacterized protein LOC143222305 isoform X2 [Tachypleus tridentatus]